MTEKFIHKNGKATLFKNNYKTEDKQPDMKGSGTTLDGKQIDIAAWKGETQSGEIKLSLTFSEPYVKASEEKQGSDSSAKKETIEDPDLPF